MVHVRVFISMAAPCIYVRGPDEAAVAEGVDHVQEDESSGSGDGDDGN